MHVEHFTIVLDLPSIVIMAVMSLLWGKTSRIVGRH